MSCAASFSRMEIALLVLLWAVVFVLIFGGNNYATSVRNARETELKVDLKTTRMAIEDYTQDKRQPPQSLQTLVDEKYLGTIPTNPFTRKAAWIPHHVQVHLDGGRSAVGIDDVHASAPYTEW